MSQPPGPAGPSASLVVSGHWQNGPVPSLSCVGTDRPPQRLMYSNPPGEPSWAGLPKLCSKEPKEGDGQRACAKRFYGQTGLGAMLPPSPALRNLQGI